MFLVIWLHWAISFWIFDHHGRGADVPGMNLAIMYSCQTVESVWPDPKTGVLVIGERSFAIPLRWLHGS